MPDKIEKCPLCGDVCEQKYLWSHTDTTQSKYEKENTNYQPQKYDLYLCKKCGVEHWNPMKNPGGVWYERDERYANRNINPTLVPGLQHILAIRKMKEDVIFTGGSDILDVGCGNGNFLAYAYKNGFTGEGFDYDRDGIESGRRAFGLDGLTSDDLSGWLLKNPGRQFSFITFFDVFEHIDNHNQFINQIKSITKSNSEIIFSIPHSLGSRFIMTSDVPPRHLTRWSPTAITNFLETRGFKVEKIDFIAAPFHQIVLKMKWKYGKFLNFGLVNKMRQREAKETYKNEQGKISYIPKITLKIKLLQLLAKFKDYLFFGLPALVFWLYLFPQKSRYTDMVIFAKLK